MTTPILLDVATLIRNFVDLSLRLNGPSSRRKPLGTLGAVHSLTLQFRDSRLELVYLAFCVGMWDFGAATIGIRTVAGFLAYYILLFTVTFIVSTPSGVEFDAFGIRAYVLAFSATVAADLIFWLWYQSLRRRRDDALAETGKGAWAPLARLVAMMGTVTIMMCLLIAVVALIGENVTGSDPLNPFGACVRRAHLCDRRRTTPPHDARASESAPLGSFFRHVWSSPCTLRRHACRRFPFDGALHRG